jgi:dedicator of cytokinesis protein 3
VINSSDPVPAEFDDPAFDGQFVEITTLTPSSMDEMNGGEFKWDATKAPLRLKKYYRENETNTFFYTYTKKVARKKGDNEFRNLWVTKVFVVADESIPCMRRRVPVRSEQVVTFTPLQTAINNLKVKNEDVKKIIEQCQTDPSHNVNDLSMNLNGILDAAVMGGVAKYKQAFFDGTYLTQSPSELQIVSGFYVAFQEQIRIAKIGMSVYEKHAPENLQPHVSHLLKCYSKMKAELADFLKHAPRA